VWGRQVKIIRLEKRTIIGCGWCTGADEKPCENNALSGRSSYAIITDAELYLPVQFVHYDS
jgi:hypothetical protein